MATAFNAVVCRIETDLAAGKRAHVLTGSEQQAAEIAELVGKTFGTAEVGFVGRETSHLPDTRVVVGAANIVCFTFLTQSLRGQKERERAEEIMRASDAIVVNVRAEERDVPCRVSDCGAAQKEGRACRVLASITLTDFFQRYASSVDVPGG